MLELPSDFIHTPPKGFSYHVKEYKKTIVSIWIRNHARFSYTEDPVLSIWGFCKTKTTAKRGIENTYYAPINSNKVGKEVSINDTTPCSAMQLNLRGLELLWT